MFVSSRPFRPGLKFESKAKPGALLKRGLLVPYLQQSISFEFTNSPIKLECLSRAALSSLVKSLQVSSGGIFTTLNFLRKL